ncbi:hypothetical protein GCM10022416_38650 [Actinomadura keratinilytica]|uniref:Uncharacterized protein n=1 Tax=Actinomadura keratinilytica TaxID=547461 RepID=A0ABP7Z3N4_9ACTN
MLRLSARGFSPSPPPQAAAPITTSTTRAKRILAINTTSRTVRRITPPAAYCQHPLRPSPDSANATGAHRVGRTDPPGPRRVPATAKTRPSQSTTDGFATEISRNARKASPKRGKRPAVPTKTPDVPEFRVLA